ncbi:MAG: 50S ribosomal protein L18 [Actinomycetota bacterium]|nr:50S ribosomal protein L18 [Actinomycetota bacterium]
MTGKTSGRYRRKKGIRKKVKGSAERPRLSVFRSNGHIYCQVIDDERGVTIAAASTNEKRLREQAKSVNKKEAAALVGAIIAERAIENGVEKVVFDRSGYAYHGRVAALAEAARKGGLKF